MSGTFFDFNNSQVAGLPLHLREYIVQQYYEHYTATDHAVWRYVMRQNYSFLKDIAYYPYIPGLKKAGLTIERIPDLQEMNDALGKIGWGAVTVDGFIPPAAFMEYQEYHVLVIAADIRQLKHIDYTPAPDIIHESAGHAPIIAEPDYNKYLSYFGSIGSKAMFSSADFKLYEAIRELSILKEMPGADRQSILAAEERVACCQQNLGEPSEMALLSRLHWWTVEYGLIGTLDNPKIYGAGLLSSIGESSSCMQPAVEKLSYTIDAINYSYDITSQQPQLFVTPDFQRLISVLDEFADTMAFRTGGSSGITKAIKSGKVATTLFSSGLQASGVVCEQHLFNGEPSFIRFTGPVSLAFNNTELAGHGRSRHSNGFSSPTGKLVKETRNLENFDTSDRLRIGLVAGQKTSLVFESGISVHGRIKEIFTRNSRLLLITFSDCHITDRDQNLLFDPSRGDYDMAVASEIVSVFPGPADRAAYDERPVKPATNTFHPVYSEDEKHYHSLFQKVRDCREGRSSAGELETVFGAIVTNFEDDWLCLLELLEIAETKPPSGKLAAATRTELERRAILRPEFQTLINNGLNLLRLKVTG